MFGSVKPYTPDLYVRENEYFKSVYCGLCRSMGKHTTELSCASLSFDMTFFALVRIWISEERAEIKMRRCPAHPFRRRNIMTDSAALEYSAYVSAYMAYYKILDDIADERGFKRFLAKLAKPFAKRSVKKVPLKYSAVGDVIKSDLDKLSSLEREKCKNPSEVAEVFGHLLGECLSFGLEDDKAAITREIGVHVGKWVYLADAACDLKSDNKSGSYNPFIEALGYEEAEKFISDGLDGVLSMELLGALSAYDLGPSGNECAGCISNILIKGMRHTMAENLEKSRKKEKK